MEKTKKKTIEQSDVRKAVRWILLSLSTTDQLIPVSNLAIVSKLLERSVSAQTTKYFKDCVPPILHLASSEQ